MSDQNERWSVPLAVKFLCVTFFVAIGVACTIPVPPPPDQRSGFTVVPTAPGNKPAWLVVQIAPVAGSSEHYYSGAFTSDVYDYLSPGTNYTVTATAGTAGTGVVYQGVVQKAAPAGGNTVRVDLPLTQVALTWQKRGAGEYAAWATPWYVDDADKLAKALSANLVSLTSAEEQAWVRQTFASSTPLWLGLQGAEPAAGKSSSDTIWSWSSGEPVVYTNWGAGEPPRISATDPSSTHISTVYTYLMDDGTGGRWYTAAVPRFERYVVLERPAGSP